MTDGDFSGFAERYEAGRPQLVCRWIAADLDTPVSAWLKLCADERYALLLESVEGGAKLGRYTALALRPDFFWRWENGAVSVSADGVEWTPRAGVSPLEDLKASIRAARIDTAGEKLPPMAASGLFGYLGYDMVRLIEDIPDANPDTLGIPGALLIRPRVMVIFDNVRRTMLVSVPVRAHAGNGGAGARAEYDAAMAMIGETIAALDAPLAPQGRARSALSLPLPVSANMTREAYHGIVRKAVEHIRAGDIFQVVPSQRFRAPFDLPPFDLYRALRRVNPSPFLFFLRMGDFSLVGSSPEILVRVRGGTVSIRPIAGTRKRGETEAEDKALAEELLADPKERAEHLMLLDLGRNDVGRTAEIGSVRVTERFIIEYYSHVMHIVSNVEGRLKQGLDSLDALFAGFPAGTVSGAPKIRAMQIIDDLEPERRGFYGGCVGYFDGSGDVDTCIALRTALVKDGELVVQAGGGVVADSDPEFEYQECRNKARALIHAAELAIGDSLKTADTALTGRAARPPR